MKTYEDINDKLYIVSGIALKEHNILRREVCVQHCLFHVEADDEKEAEDQAYLRIIEDFPRVDGWLSYNILLINFAKVGELKSDVHCQRY